MQDLVFLQDTQRRTVSNLYLLKYTYFLLDQSEIKEFLTKTYFKNTTILTPHSLPSASPTHVVRGPFTSASNRHEVPQLGQRPRLRRITRVTPLRLAKKPHVQCRRHFEENSVLFFKHTFYYECRFPVAIFFFFFICCSF